jgi:anaerobic C4-dicarboxylate transporter
MFWLLFCGFFLLMLFSILRMLNQRGKWAWCLFLGLIASAGLYVGLFVVPVASAAALENRRVLLALILVSGTLIYAGGMIYFIRRMSVKLRVSPSKRS